MIRAFAALGLVAAFGGSAFAQSPCIDESKTNVVVRGQLLPATDTDNEGKPRHYFRLALETPICLEDFPKTREVHDIKSVRLEPLGPDARQQVKALAGEKVVATGSFGIYDEPVDIQAAALDAHRIQAAQ